MGEAEAYYKIFPNLTLKYSSIDTIFVPSDKKELRSTFLMKIDENDPSYSKGAQVKGGRDGIFLEKPDLIDKYCRRDIELCPKIKDLCLTQFAKLYEPIRGRKNEEEINDYLPEDDIIDEEEKAANNIILQNKIGEKLPFIIKIKDPVPGEISTWKKRTFPRAMRIHKKKVDNDPHRYFLSELLLYTSFTNEEELGANDEARCRQLYLEKKESIQYIKKHLMSFLEGVEEARYYVDEALKKERLER